MLDNAVFLLIAENISDRNDLQVLQSDALRVCYNVRLRDGMSIVHMHHQANLISIEQQRQNQLLNLMFIYKNRHENMRAANVYSSTCECYYNNKYTISPYYKGALLWDELPISAKQCLNVKKFKKVLKRVYVRYDDTMS